VTLINLEHIERRFGDVDVLTGASLRVEAGDRIGVVGGNGTGKTTLVRILAGVDEPDRGARTVARDLRIAYAEQAPTLAAGTTVLQFVERGDGEFQELERRVRALEAALAEKPGDERLLETYGHLQGKFEAGGGYERAHLCPRVLGGIGFPEADWQKDVSVLSGGEQSRLLLAALMTAPADLLVLDEPTNHLDLEGIEFVESHIERHPGAVVVVSHDRHFLDAVARHIVEVEDGVAARYKGNYSAYRSQRDQRLLAEARAFKNQQAFIDKEMEYIRRNMAGRMSAQAKGRLKKLQRLQVLQAPGRQAAGMHLRFTGGRGLSGQTMIEAEGLTLRVPGGRVLLDSADFKLLHGETVGLLGRNGSGKSTLIRTVAGLRRPDGGELRIAHGVEIGYFSQQVSDLPKHVTVLDALRELDPSATEKEMRGHLALFLFCGDEVEARVDDLSGGEKQRLSLARLTRSQFDLLCLDEPTNHLDIPAREGLEQALRAYPGAVLLITHDRQLLETATDRILHLENARLRRFDGGLGQCLRTLAAERQRPRVAQAGAQRGGVARGGATRGGTGRGGAAPAKSDGTPAADGKKPGDPGKIRNPLMFQKLEEEIFDLEDRLARLRDDMTKEANYLDHERMKRLKAEEAELDGLLAVAYERWENWS